MHKKRRAVMAEENVVIRIECSLPGHEGGANKGANFVGDGEHVDFKGKGWKYRHLRLWESSLGADELVELIAERILGWKLTDEDGARIPFRPDFDQPDLEPAILQPPLKEAFDDLPGPLARWLVSMAYLDAYRQAG